MSSGSAPRRELGIGVSLQESVARLGREIERSRQLKADISAAVEDRRYELHKCSTTIGPRAAERSLAAAQRGHLASLLKVIHAIAAAAAAKSGDRAPPARRALPFDPLARNIRELGASVERARRLSQDVRVECEGRGWREGTSPLLGGKPLVGR